MDVFESFYQGSSYLSRLNSGWICPTPKNPTILLALDLRPISLIHNLGKIISKVLATRLQSVMNQLINLFHAAFIKGRHILDNFYCAHILIHHLNVSKTSAAILKIDFQQKFDQINWTFLLELFKARGFSEKWIGWISDLLGSNTSAVLLNGVPGRTFIHKRGLRQGDPLSPLLFILCIDVLFRLMKKAVFSAHLPTVGIGDVKIHSIIFADDVLLFFDGSIRSATTIKSILEAFSICSGLKINFDKSFLTPINISEDQATGISNIFNFPLQPFPLSYLGLPLSLKNLRRVDYLPIIENIDKRLAGWKSASLSRGGRIILLNSVLSSLPTYFYLAFALLVWVIKAIERVQRGFFWKGKYKTNGFHCLANWNHVCRPKSVGGIEIKNLQMANSSLLMKGLWKYYTAPTLPWVNLLKQKHYKRRLTAVASHTPNGCCPIWRGMIRLQAPFLTLVDFILHDGKETPFWSGRWCGEAPLRNRFLILYAASTKFPDYSQHLDPPFCNSTKSGFQLSLQPSGAT